MSDQQQYAVQVVGYTNVAGLVASLYTENLNAICSVLKLLQTFDIVQIRQMFIGNALRHSHVLQKLQFLIESAPDEVSIGAAKFKERIADIMI